jgi:hypothetical protein|tara:strand:+ start:1302 stop:2666 length:1365 start_codon:yes stop_codon:yes gene_type:complete
VKETRGIREEPFIGTFSSFSEKHTELIRSIIRHLRKPASVAVVTSENYALQEHYVREIVSNVFVEKENGEVKRAPLNRDSIIKKVNVRLREIEHIDLKSQVQGFTQELWLFELTKSELVSPLSLVHRILSQFKQAGISVLILTTGIAWRSEEMKKWVSVTKTPLWSFDLPNEGQCADFIRRAERDGSLNTARELVNKLAVQEDVKDDVAQIVTFDPLALVDKIQADKSTDQVKDENESKERVGDSEPRLVKKKKRAYVGYAVLIFSLITFPTSVLLGDIITDGIKSMRQSFEEISRNQTIIAFYKDLMDYQEIKAIDNKTKIIFASEEDVTIDEAGVASFEETTLAASSTSGKPDLELVATSEDLPQVLAPDVKPEEDIIEANYFLQEAAFRNKNAAFAWIAKRSPGETVRVELKKNNYWAVIKGPYREAELSRIRSRGGFKDFYIISASDLLN